MSDLERLRNDYATAAAKWDTGDHGGAWGWLSRSVRIYLEAQLQAEQERDDWASRTEAASLRG